MSLDLAASPDEVAHSSAALGAAKAGLRGTKRSLPTLQAASALGQAELQRAWHDAFEPAGLQAAQVLLTGAEIPGRRVLQPQLHDRRPSFQEGGDEV